MHANVAQVLFQTVSDITGFARGEFAFTYLGCPVFYTRRRKDCYDDLVKKVKARLHSWKGKLLSFGEKATLITGVLQSMPVHLLSVLDPPDNILEHLHKIFARLFWITKEEGSEEYWDRPYWMPTSSDKFIVSSAWQILRHSANPNPKFKHMWIKGLPFKISFFLWILWRHKLSTDDLWKRQGYIHVSRYWCCQHPREETFDHIFLTTPTASKVWKIFFGDAGINVPLVQVKQVIRAWWNTKYYPKLRPLFQAAPTIITWELRKKRNTSRNIGTISTNRVIHKVNKTLHYLARFRYPWLSHILVMWPDMIKFFEGYKPILITKKVTWQASYEGWYKCNTYGASKGNPGPSSLGFCGRNDAGDLVYARAVDLGVTTNIVAEAKAIVQGLEYCIEHDLHPLILETNSLVLKKVIEGEWDPH
ncbi:uncharacterized protein [Nicotiana tomentosiformis]|uniref:uncharacterized protein n=1 Tax=Nicotiana tomentosiformis TaxID=4098 RepID=UPI00388C3CA1